MSSLMKVLRICKAKGQTDLWTRLIVTVADLYNEKYIKSNEGRACLRSQQVCAVIKWVNTPRWIHLDSAVGYVATARPFALTTSAKQCCIFVRVCVAFLSCDDEVRCHLQTSTLTRWIPKMQTSYWERTMTIYQRCHLLISAYSKAFTKK